MQRFKPSYENMIYNIVMGIDFIKIDFKIIDNIGIISLNRPELKNILDIDVFREINRAIDLFENNEQIKIILFKSNSVISKNGKKIFSAGVNLKEYDKKFELVEKNPAEFKSMLEYSRLVLNKIESLSKPVIAAVDGIAVGGSFEIILACDMVLASEKAGFCLSEINIGLIPGYGGIHRLLKSIGKNKTFEIVATGRIVMPEEALSLGIVSEIYSDENFEEKIMKYLRLLSQKSPNSLKLIKNTINNLAKIPNNDEIEVNNFLKAISSTDAKEGVYAFLEKRIPNF